MCQRPFAPRKEIVKKRRIVTFIFVNAFRGKLLQVVAIVGRHRSSLLSILAAVMVYSVFSLAFNERGTNFCKLWMTTWLPFDFKRNKECTEVRPVRRRIQQQVADHRCCALS